MTLNLRHILTPEYPPQSGGVSDYVVQLAEGLAREGEEVHVWGPAAANAGPAERAATVQTHRDLGRMTPGDLKTLGHTLDRFPAPRSILLQWVPHGFGYRSMNLGFCVWLWKRARRGDRVEIMVHEAFLRFEGSWRQYGAALVHRLMTVILLRSAQRIWVSIPRYEQMWRPYTLGRRIPFQWLPLPSNVPVIRDPRGIAALRSQYTAGDGLLIGHFGTFGTLVNSLLLAVIPGILDRNSAARLLLIGPGAGFLDRLIAEHPRLAGRIYTTGGMAATDPALSRHIGACDVLIQPYPDGASSRRTSLMAPLQHGKAVATTSGPATEAVWFESRAVVMTATGDAEAFIGAVNGLCADSGQRTELARAARKLFEERFDIRHAVAAVRLAGDAARANRESVRCAS
jgi:glycosyltransferase involved in cell wall biosynthesis